MKIVIVFAVIVCFCGCSGPMDDFNTDNAKKVSSCIKLGGVPWYYIYLILIMGIVPTRRTNNMDYDCEVCGMKFYKMLTPVMYKRKQFCGKECVAKYKECHPPAGELRNKGSRGVGYGKFPIQ